ncbi:MAG: ABC-type transport auxiliary lipoprotein family protein [Candidatus Binatia bacterium]
MHRLIAPTILPLLILCCGCVSLERSYPEKRYFVIVVPESANRSSSAGNRILSVSNLRISPRYADKNFVYRISEAGYEADFYNQFLTSPDLMIGEEVRKGLAASQVFKYVVGPSNQLQPNYVLEGSINTLYGDFRDAKMSAAFLEIEFFLHNEDAANPGIVMQKRYVKSVPLSERSPEALVKGWNDALNEILAALIVDLRVVNF